MKPNMQKIILVLFLLLQSMYSYSYVIKGTIVDEAGKPIRKAVIIGRNSVKKVVVWVETDGLGQFSSTNVNDSTLAIEISKNDYATVYYNIVGTPGEFVDLGIIKLKPMVVNLGEVVVTAQTVIQKPDRYLIIPLKKEIEQATNGLSLLSGMQYKIPGLTVNESLQTVKVDNVTPVFKINGKPSDISHILALNPERILRIEYQDNPDVRYENRRVINIILNPRDVGGSIIANVVSGANAGFINSNIGASYHYKKSEWELNYRTNWRDYNEREISSFSEFIGRSTPISRERIGIPSNFRYLSNELSLGYTYMHNPNTVFAAKAGMGFENQKMNDDSWNTQEYMGNLYKYQNLTHRKLGFHSPSVDLFYRKQIDQSQYIETNVYGRYSSGDYNRSYMNIYQSLLPNDFFVSDTENKSWRVGADLMYSKTFKYLSTNFGIQDYFNDTDNEQTESGTLNRDKISQNRLSAYTQILGRIKRLNYSISAIGIYNHSNNNSYKTNAVRLKSNVTINYPISQHLTLNYLLMYDPALPSVSQQSDLVQTIDEISVRQGNPDLKPSLYIRNRVYLRYADKRFSGSLWASHSRNMNPIYYAYNYISDTSNPYYDKFMSRPINGQHNDQINLELNLSTQELFGFATVWGNIGWDNMHINMPGKSHVKNRFYASLNGALSFGNWTMSSNYQIRPRYDLSGNSYTSEDRWNTVKVQYKYKNWYFSLTGVNLFTKRGNVYNNITVSDVHPETYTQSIRDCANMILLGVNYRFDLGKKGNKTKRSLNNDGIEQGIDINY